MERELRTCMQESQAQLQRRMLLPEAGVGEHRLRRAVLLGPWDADPLPGLEDAN